jgi:hypothetical protein
VSYPLVKGILERWAARYLDKIDDATATQQFLRTVVAEVYKAIGEGINDTVFLYFGKRPRPTREQMLAQIQQQAVRAGLMGAASPLKGLAGDASVGKMVQTGMNIFNEATDRVIDKLIEEWGEETN